MIWFHLRNISTYHLFTVTFSPVFFIFFYIPVLWASLLVPMVKNLPAMWETWVWFLGWEDLLEKGKATHSVFLLGEFCGQRSLAGPWVCKESEDSVTFTFACFLHLFLYLYLKKWFIYICIQNEQYKNMNADWFSGV